MDVKAKVILPRDVLDKYPNAIGIICDTCQLEYSLDDYRILKNNSKYTISIGTSSKNEEKDSLFLDELCEHLIAESIDTELIERLKNNSSFSTIILYNRLESKPFVLTTEKHELVHNRSESDGIEHRSNVYYNL